jgi:hypothetical protein
VGVAPAEDQTDPMPDENRLGRMVSRIGSRLGLEPRGPRHDHRSMLTAFHCEDGRDHAGRSHAGILAFDDHAMHSVHDFIQWLFPLPEPSNAFIGAPVMSDDDLAVMRASELCQRRLEAAHARMAAFLVHNPVWLRLHDHNHLRITRMIRSTRLISGDGEADRFRGFILEHVDRRKAHINPTTLHFWAHA